MAHYHQHPLVSSGPFDLLAAILVQVKRKQGQKAYGLLEARMELYDVLEALRIAGYNLVPKGIVDNIRRILGELP